MSLYTNTEIQKKYEQQLYHQVIAMTDFNISESRKNFSKGLKVKLDLFYALLYNMDARRILFKNNFVHAVYDKNILFLNQNIEESKKHNFKRFFIEILVSDCRAYFDEGDYLSVSTNLKNYFGWDFFTTINPEKIENLKTDPLLTLAYFEAFNLYAIAAFALDDFTEAEYINTLLLGSLNDLFAKVEDGGHFNVDGYSYDNLVLDALYLSALIHRKQGRKEKSLSAIVALNEHIGLVQPRFNHEMRVFYFYIQFMMTNFDFDSFDSLRKALRVYAENNLGNYLKKNFNLLNYLYLCYRQKDCKVITKDAEIQYYEDELNKETTKNLTNVEEYADNIFFARPSIRD